MTTLQNFRVDVSTKGWCCVFDVQLALSRFGLALALRLSEQMECWQVRSFWQMLDDSDYYLAQAKMLQQGGDRLAIFSPDVADSSQSREILDDWQTARFQSDLMSRLCWLGYSVEESMLPKDIDSQLDQRFEILAQNLEQRHKNGKIQPQSGNIKNECSRDAVALTAALSRYKPFILTLCQTGNNKTGEVREPALCEYIRNCGIGCVKAGADAKINAMTSYLIQTFTNIGLLELIYASNINLAVIHVVAPKAYVMHAQHSEEQLDSQVIPIKSTANQSGPLQSWNGCTAFWYPLWH